MLILVFVLKDSYRLQGILILVLVLVGPVLVNITGRRIMVGLFVIIVI